MRNDVSLSQWEKREKEAAKFGMRLTRSADSSRTRDHTSPIRVSTPDDHYQKIESRINTELGAIHGDEVGV